MPPISLPLAEAYQPISFAERGIDAPFTAPLLAGARIRAMRHPGIELIVPNPAGGRGVYILPWSSARTLCSPTLHDLRLHEELRVLPALTPSTVRLAARRIARAGLAGEAAQQAAVTAATADVEARRRLASVLWMGLGSATLPGATPGAVGHDLDAIAALYVPLGLPRCLESSRLPRLQAALQTLHGEAALWARGNAGDELANVAGAVADAAATNAALSAPLIAGARALAADVPNLLRHWSRDRDAVAERIGRAEWVLDGWERIVLLWREGQLLASQRSALLEMAQLVPELPEEALAWAGNHIGLSLPPVRSCRVISLNETWRTGSASFSLIARNERFRAQCA